MVATVQGDENVIAKLHAKLEKGGLTLAQKYRILFSLRNCANASALDALLLALKDPSALFRHDVAFALGQRQDPAAVEALKRILRDESEHCMVRHEAGEALGAIGTPECLDPLREHEASAAPEVADTCLLASQRMAYFAEQRAQAEEGRFQSVDPTPPYPSSMTYEELQSILADEQGKLFDRYRALFALRNKGGEQAVEGMAQCLKTSSSALLKHEVAYVLGQLMDKRSVQCLKDALERRDEHAMVRHEAAEALGSIADETCIQLLKEYCGCDEPIVADSCVVALDMIEHERSGAFEYADMGESL